MTITRSWVKGALLCGTVFALGSAQLISAQTTGYITGVVRSEKGPEAGVWVIAETKELPTKMVKEVVTDDRGRFALPDLPNVTYDVWVRGYGLVDSPKIQMKPTTKPVDLKAVIAPSAEAAAQYYPGNYWLSMMAPPPKSDFPGTGTNGIGKTMLDQDHWINMLKSNCNFCHQLGDEVTRDLTHVYKGHPEAKTPIDAWEWRLGTGVRGNSMYTALIQMGKEGTLKQFAEWTSLIEKGAVPPAPPRPTGVERNVVVTMWDVGDDHSFMHDQISTDKQKPTVNAYGPSYAVNAGHGQLVVLDQKDNSTYTLDIPTREDRSKIGSRFPPPNRPSLFWGEEHLWSTPDYDPADPHNPMIDSKGRVWMTSKIRGNNDPAWCSDPSNKYADWFPLKRSGRQTSFYDPKTKKFTLIDTCFSTHHLQLDNDPDETMYYNELIGPIIGWVDTKVYDQTHDEQKAQGWCGQVLDTNGDGKITRPFNVITPHRGGEDLLYNGDTQGGGGGPKGTAFNPKLDSMVAYNLYSVIPDPHNDVVYGISESYPGILVRMDRGKNPPETCKTQIFKVPSGFDPRGVDIDTNGVVWTALAGSSALASFDIRKCKDLNGPAKLDGSQCKDSWTIYTTDGPRLKGTDIPADFHYYNWVDQDNIMGFGKNTPFLTGSNSDAEVALDPQTKKWTYLRVPYPLGFYSRGMDARIDDPKAGWKGRGMYSNYGTHFVWHIEGGKGTKGKIVKFQIRPNPLAK